MVDGGELLLSVSYNITNEETEKAFKIYQKKFVFPKCIIYTVVYMILAALFIQQIMLDPNYQTAYFLAGLCGVLAVTVWLQPLNVRKKLLNALKDIDDDSYTADFFEKTVEITTSIRKKHDNEVSLVIDETADKTVISPPKTILSFVYDKLKFAEADDMFLLFVRKQTIYVFPKRCLADEHKDTLREILTEKI